MSRQTQIALFWLGTLAAIVAALFVFRAILLPFVAGTALAYALDPVANWLEKQRVNRTVAALAIVVLIAILFVAVFVLIVPVLINQLVDFLQQSAELDRTPADAVRSAGSKATGRATSASTRRACAPR